MKLSVQIAVTAAGVLVALAGAVLPLQNQKTALQAEVDDLGLRVNTGVDVDVQIEVVRQRIEELEADLDSRTVVLLHDTSSARHNFESALQSQLTAAGLPVVSMDRQPGREIGGKPTFEIDLVVEGQAKQLHGFLVGLEALQWVSRVLQLDIAPGLGGRQITMKIAVPMETSS